MDIKSPKLKTSDASPLITKICNELNLDCKSLALKLFRYLLECGDTDNTSIDVVASTCVYQAQGLCLTKGEIGHVLKVSHRDIESFSKSIKDQDILLPENRYGTVKPAWQWLDI